MPFVIVWTIITIILSRRNTDALKDVISAKQTSHKKEVEMLKRTHRDEILKLKNLQENYLETIRELESKFEVQNKKLSEKHVEDVKEIVIKSKGNSDEIKKRIEDEFGIKFTN